MAASEYATVQVQGLRELGEALRQLPQRIGRNVLRGSVGAGARRIRDKARENAPRSTGPVSEGHPAPGTLKHSIIIKQIPERSGPLAQTFYVYVRSGKKYARQGKGGRLSQDAYYWKFLEFGTKAHVVRPTKKKALAFNGKVRSVARIPAIASRPFMRSAFESEKARAVEDIKRYLLERLPEEVEKLPRMRMLWAR